MLITPYYRRTIALTLLLAPVLAGCSSLRIGRHSLPARCVTPALLDGARSSMEPIDYTRLRQETPDVYKLAPEDVLGVFIEGVLGQREAPPPVHFPQQEGLPPAIGYPVLVRQDGTVDLPLMPPVQVAGLTLAEATEKIRKAYTEDLQILQKGRDRIIVTLMRKRTFHVLVIREDVGAPLAGGDTYRPGEIILEPQKRGRAYTLELPAYQNDVLHALAASGGLPGVDAKNEVKILRGGFKAPKGEKGGSQLLEELKAPMPENALLAEDPNEFLPEDLDVLFAEDSNVIRIPLQASLGEPPVELTEDDIILHTGDVVVVESRESEVYYTGGLMRGSQFAIPRDYDLDVLGAIAMAGGSIAPGGGGAGYVPGIGAMGGSTLCSPTRVTILRTTGDGQVPIRVDLKRAALDPKERVLIQPNDIVLLEYTEYEMMTNFIVSKFFVNFSMSGPLWK